MAMDRMDSLGYGNESTAKYAVDSGNQERKTEANLENDRSGGSCKTWQNSERS